jgi:hypothetical protein
MKEGLVDYTEFRQGFVISMKEAPKWSTYEKLKMGRRPTTELFLRGYEAAMDLWDGKTTDDTALAETLGLVEAYKGFHGQEDWHHPTY